MIKPNHDHSGHRARMKARFLKEKSFDSFQPHNVLEYLLFYTIPIRDTNEIAHRLLNQFGSLSGVFDAPYSELLKVEGVGPHTASLIKSILPLSRAYAMDKEAVGMILDSTESVSQYVKSKYLGYEDEVYSIISLDNRNQVIAYDIVTKGSLSTVSLDARKTMEILLNRGASCVVLAHNHPGGLAVPSGADITATKNFAICCQSLGVRVMDHVIVCNEECVSMKETKETRDIFD